MVAPLARIVADRQHLLPAQTDAAHELLPLDELLRDHREPARLVVVLQQLVERAAHVHFLPAAAVRVLQDAGQPGVLHDRPPVERIDQVAQALVVHDAGHVLLVRQYDRLRVRDAEPVRERSAEELVIGRPHERVVHHGDALQHGVLQEGPVVRYLVRDAVDQHRVLARLAHARAAQLDVLRDHALVPPIDLFDEGRREGPLPAHDQAHLQRHDNPRMRASATASARGWW